MVTVTVPDTTAGRRSRWPALIAALTLVGAVGGCAEPNADPGVERGRRVYLAQCIACHNADPSKDGAVGPPVKGASRELLEAKVVKGAYPPGYAPKRRTAIMPPQPALARDISDLATFLR
jgi:mono/diheme cytochrome c family protein